MSHFVSSNRFSKIKFLLNCGDYPILEEVLFKMVWKAFDYGKWSLMKMTLEKHYDLKIDQPLSRDEIFLLILKKNIEKGCLSWLKRLQKQYPNKFSLVYHDILDYAVSLEQFPVIGFLLECGDYPISEKLCVRIAWLSLKANSRWILTIVERYPDLKIPGSSLMHLAVRRAHFKIIEKVRIYQDDFNVRDDLGRTPLHYAVLIEERSINFVEDLCLKGADIFLEDADGMTPIQLAEREKNFEAFYYMMRQKPQMSEEDIGRVMRLGLELKEVDSLLEFIAAYPTCCKEFLKKYFENCHLEKFKNDFGFFLSFRLNKYPSVDRSLSSATPHYGMFKFYVSFLVRG